MSSNGAGRASVPGVGCRVSVLAAEVGAAAVLFMSQRARTFDYATTTLFFKTCENAFLSWWSWPSWPMSRKARWSDDLEPFSRLEPGTLGRAIGSMPYERLTDEPLQPEPLPAPSPPTATPGPAHRPACASSLASEPFSRLLPGTLGRAMGCSSYVRFADEPRQPEPEPPKPVAAPAAAAATATPGPRSASFGFGARSDKSACLPTAAPTSVPTCASAAALQQPQPSRPPIGASSGSSSAASANPRCSISSQSQRSSSTILKTAAAAVKRGKTIKELNAKLEKPDAAKRDRACLKIQRWYRQHSAMYAAYGPMMFANKDGSMSDFGMVSFLSGSRVARFIRVSDTTSCAALSHFLEKFWRLPRPDVLISVTGSAATLTLTANLQRVFDRGLAMAAAMTNAWIFTGGTDSGVMKLVGEAIHKYGLDVPLVGVAPWGAVLGRQGMHGCKGDTRVYRAGGQSGPHAARLNPYHTHQILVDGHRQYDEGSIAWGHEVRTSLECR